MGRAVSDRLYAGAYWGPRSEEPGRCGERLLACLTELARVAVPLAAWHPKGGRRSTASTPNAAMSPAAIAAALQKGVNRRDADGSEIAELGRSLSLWNGQTEDGADFFVHCGSVTKVPGILNSFVLRLPALSASAERLTPERARDLMVAIVNAWDPDWAVISSDALRDAQLQTPGWPFVGWLTYFSAARGPIPALPNWARAEYIATGGTLIRIDPFADPLTTSRAKELGSLLAETGAMSVTA